MVHRCVVRGCGSSWFPGTLIIYHAFPKDKCRRTSWLAIVPLKSHFYESSRICSLHFKETDYEVLLSSKRLKSTAVPFFEGNEADHVGVSSISQESTSKLRYQKKKKENSTRVYVETDDDTLSIASVKEEITDDDDDHNSGAESDQTDAQESSSTTDEHSEAKRARLDQFESLSSEHVAEIYEFGKFVAEQLLCLDVTQARIVQEQIRDMLAHTLKTALLKGRSKQPKIENDSVDQLKIVSVESLLQPEKRDIPVASIVAKTEELETSPCTVTKSKANSTPVSSSGAKARSKVMPEVAAKKPEVNTVGKSQSVKIIGSSAHIRVLSTLDSSVAKSGTQVRFLKTALESGSSLTKSGTSNVECGASNVKPGASQVKSVASNLGHSASNVERGASNVKRGGYLIVSEGLLLGTEPGTSVGLNTFNLESSRLEESCNKPPEQALKASTDASGADNELSMLVDEVIVKTEEPELESTHTNVFPPSLMQSGRHRHYFSGAYN